MRTQPHIAKVVARAFARLILHPRWTKHVHFPEIGSVDWIRKL
jgi:hypothetical protein